MEKYHLIDYTRGKKQIFLDRIYETVSKIAIKYGGMGNDLKNYNEAYIREFWNYDDQYPTIRMVRKHVSVASLKWFIHHKIKYEADIWNADFINGLAIHGKLRWFRRNFPTFKWQGNKSLNRIIQLTTLGGKISLTRGWYGIWSVVPAFHLKYSVESVSYVAGIMAGAEPIVIDGVGYARFKKPVLSYISSLKIPIEQIEDKKYFYISPIWVALFTPKMPVEIIDDWLNISNPCKVNVYAPILWKTYLNAKFIRKGIPFLNCARKIYYEFKCDEGAMAKLDKLRVEMNLTELDNRIIEMVKMWGKNNERSNV